MVAVYERLCPGFGRLALPQPDALTLRKLTSLMAPGLQHVPLPSSQFARLPTLMKKGDAMSRPRIFRFSKLTFAIVPPSMEVRETAALRADWMRTSRKVKLVRFTSVALPNWIALHHVELIVVLRTKTLNEGHAPSPSFLMVLKQSARLSLQSRCLRSERADS